MNLRSRVNVAHFFRTQAKLSIAVLELASCNSPIHFRLYFGLCIRYESLLASIPIIPESDICDSQSCFLTLRSGFHRLYDHRYISPLSRQMTCPSKRMFRKYLQSSIFDNMETNHERRFGLLRWSIALLQLSHTKNMIYNLAAPIWSLDHIAASRQELFAWNRREGDERPDPILTESDRAFGWLPGTVVSGMCVSYRERSTSLRQ
jgi:hypothetical protein